MRTKKGSISYYKKKSDKLFSRIIRARGKCEKCGRTDGVLHCAHVIGRKNLTLRWDVMNGLALCHKHHIYWQHKEPLEFTAWFQKKYPMRFEHLMQNKNKLTKRTVQDYKELAELLEKIVKKNEAPFLTPVVTT